MTTNTIFPSTGTKASGALPPDPIPPGTVLGRKGGFEVRLCQSAEELDAAQDLRYRVFYEERGLKADPGITVTRRDSDAFDEICDHLLVLTRPDTHVDDAVYLDDRQVVGTYRLLRQEVAESTLGFYTQDEFDIAPLIASKPGHRFLELGRSCVLKPYRTRPVVELLWQGIWNYVRLHRIDVMLGCASLEGTDPEALRAPLAFLNERFRAPPEWAVRAHPENAFFVETSEELPRDDRAAMRSLPPLIKGYLRLGAYIGEGAFIDHEFNTVDILIILPVAAINSRYFSHFGNPDDVPAAL